MFGSMKKSGSAISDDIETIIGRNTQLKGTISGGGNVRIDGNLEGEIESDGNVIVGEMGEVVANVKARNILISGTIRGNVQAVEKLEILTSGKLYGDVSAAVLCVAEGAVFKGSSNMESNADDSAGF